MVLVYSEWGGNIKHHRHDMKSHQQRALRSDISSVSPQPPRQALSGVRPWSGGPRYGASRPLVLTWVNRVGDDSGSSHHQCGLGTGARLFWVAVTCENWWCFFFSSTESMTVQRWKACCYRLLKVPVSELLLSYESPKVSCRKNAKSSRVSHSLTHCWLSLHVTQGLILNRNRVSLWGIGHMCFVTSVLITPPLCSNFRCRAKRLN